MAAISRENTDKTIQANKDMANLAYQRDMEQWNRANLYNAPQAQMGRLKAAGLNPMLVYGSGTVAGQSAGQSPTMHVPEQNYAYQAKQMPQVDMSFMQQAQNLRLGRAQINNVEANTQATKQSTANEAIKNALLEIDKMFYEKEKKANLTKSESDAIFADRKNLMGLLMQSAQKAAVTQGTDINAAMFPYDLAFKKGSIRQQNEQIKALELGNKNIPLSGELTQAQTAASRAGTLSTEQQTKLLKLQGKLQNQDLIQKEWENWLRTQGVAPGEGPQQKATREVSRFLDYLFKKHTTSTGQYKKVNGKWQYVTD